MAGSRLLASRRALDALVAVCAVALVVSGTSLVRAWQAAADDTLAPLPNPDLVDRCGIPVVLALDASPAAPGGDAALAAAVSGAAASVGAELAGRGSTLGVLAYDGSGRWLTDPLQPPVVDDAALAAGGPLATALAAYGSPPTEAPSGGRSWEAALTTAAAALEVVPADRPVLILHVTTGLPDGAPYDQVTRAAAVADRLRARPATHLLTLALGPVAAAPGPLSAISGPDVVAGGSGPLAVEHDDVVTVADPGSAPAVAAELARGLCAVDLEVTVRADAASAGLPGVVLTADGYGERTTDDAGVARWRIDPPRPPAGSDPALGLHLTGGPPVAVCGQGRDEPVDVTADATGRLLGGLLPGATVRCELREADFAPSGQVEPPAADEPTGAAAEAQPPASPPVGSPAGGAAGAAAAAPPGPGAPTPQTGPAGGLAASPAAVPPADGVPWAPDDTPTDTDTDATLAGAALPPESAVRLDAVALPGVDASCPSDGAHGPSVAIAAMREVVTHCLFVRNTGGEPLTDIVVESPVLGLVGDHAWRPSGTLAPGQTSTGRAAVTLERMTAVHLGVEALGTVSGARMTATARTLMQVATPAIGVSRSLAVAGSTSDTSPCGNAVGHVRTGRRVDWCTTVTNRGGTFLDEVTVTDPALLPAPLPLAGRLAPGASITVHGSSRMGGDRLDGPTPIARALPVEADGRPVADAVEVSSDDARRPGLNAESSVDATRVPAGDEVTMSVTVSNDADQPIDAVDVEASLCGEDQEPTSQLFDNGDDQLDHGERWVYVCSAAIYSDTLAFASIVTPAQTTNTRPTGVAPDEAELRVKKSQRNDLRLSSDTTYELKVQNLGNIPAAGVVLTDPLPAGVHFVSATSDIGSCGHAGGTVTCQLGTMAPQLDLQANFVHIVVGADPGSVGQVLTNEARVTTSSPETDFRQNTSAARGKVFAIGECEGSRDCDPSVQSSSGSDDGSSSGDDDSGGALPFSDGVYSGVSGSLATTGADPDLVAAWGLVFLASGTSLLAAARRRHQLVGVRR